MRHNKLADRFTSAVNFTEMSNRCPKDIGCFSLTMFKFEFSVKKAKWLANPNLRWQKGLEGAGLQFRQRLQRSNYPPAPPMSTYIRTGTTANKAGFNIYQAGGSLTMFFGSTEYLPYLLYGTDRWVGWTPWDKKGEILKYMEAGFKKGVKEYKE